MARWARIAGAALLLALLLPLTAAADDGFYRGKTITINTRYTTTGSSKQAHNRGSGGGSTKDADGGTMGRQYLAGGGTIRGVGGPREDNISTFDRATGIQVAYTSVGEELVNARSSALNRGILKEINANPGQRFGLVRLADGGTIGKPKERASRGGNGGSSRPLILNIDMGDLGIRQIVTEIVEDRDEYSATVGRMH